MLQVFLVTLHVFRVMLQVLLVMLHMFHVMLQVFLVMLHVSCNVAGVSSNVARFV